MTKKKVVEKLETGKTIVDKTILRREIKSAVVCLKYNYQRSCHALSEEHLMLETAIKAVIREQLNFLKIDLKSMRDPSEQWSVDQISRAYKDHVMHSGLVYMKLSPEIMLNDFIQRLAKSKGGDE